ncbi:hypothetical protein M2475_000465 [Breznakia sp. PF5-3]|uniref:hypothetical protein n=1 Tax=unclassified Breznakia TaxID=2623764 RepID=UPI002407310A|nr:MULTISPECIES: hypothetical protein [unclassified Breznakia]MDF9824115.1 hypothetical protein [Breznakia sp. PM6-1]MDF9834913.1 hypothetical protein [Breznakia sp. PF5-3]MDF9837218.1 hypothetical protein [Breznakia sp. PFB2-8]MDF9859208.1 hypothetical protein [Breznakia sp. PH5-24]
MDYYDALIVNVKELINNNKIMEAYSILKEELNMPYIPFTHESELNALFVECKQMLQSDTQSKKHHDEDIETLLFGSVDEANMACEILRNSNIRKYLDIVEAYLSDKPHYLIRTLLIEILMEQDVSDEIKLMYEGLEVSFVPVYVERIQENEATMEMVKLLKNYFENDNPTFYKMCVECLVKELYLKLPFNVVLDEINYLVVAIIEYVYKANGDEEAFKLFIDEKNLAMYEGYDLLLYKYEV